MLIWVIVILVFSVMLHEIAHGLVALWHGDPTAKQARRLTLNPLHHLDVVGSFVVPVILYLAHMPILGWAKPVPYNPRYFRFYRWGLFSVSVAGPMTNILLALFFSAILKMAVLTPVQEIALGYAITINVILAVFNLLPIPPLDGSKAVSVLLPPKAHRAYLSMGSYGFVIIIVLLSLGLFHRALWPLVKNILEVLL